MTTVTRFLNVTGRECLDCGMCVLSPGDPAKAGGDTIKYPALMSSPAASLAQTLVSLVKAQVLQANSQDSGLNLSASLANFDLASSSWRTCQLSLFEAVPPLLERLPKWGMWGHGVLYQQPTPEPATGVNDGGVWPTANTEGMRNGSGSRDIMRRAVTKHGANQNEIEAMLGCKLWPTPQAFDANDLQRSSEALERAKQVGGCSNLREHPALWATPTAQDGSNNGGPSQHQRNSLPLNAQVWPTPRASESSTMVGGTGHFQMLEKAGALELVSNSLLNPTWVEQLQGYPPGWTLLDQDSPNTHGKPREQCRPEACPTEPAA